MSLFDENKILSSASNTSGLTIPTTADIKTFTTKEEDNSDWVANYTRFASRIIDTPLMIQPGKLEAIITGLNKGPLALRGLEGAGRTESFKVKNGTAIIPVHGTLVQRASGMDAFSGMTSYQSISAQINEALEDDSIDNILLDIDSPGGEVSGVFELADEIFAAREIKPIAAFANELAASAAYLIASSTEQIYGKATSNVGSIGVVLAHQDFSENLKMQGIKITHIFAGEHKVDGNSAEPLSDDVRSDLQAKVDTLRTMFAETVARNRGIDLKTVLDTEARVYMGSEGLKPGLIDQIATFDTALSDLFVNDFQLNDLRNGEKMSEENLDSNDVAEEVETLDTDALKAEATSAERERILAILGDDVSEFQAQLIADGIDAKTSAGLIKAAGVTAKNTSLDTEMSKEDEVLLNDIEVDQEEPKSIFDPSLMKASSNRVIKEMI